jgi:hypothetical protein
MNGTYNLGNLGVDGRKILKWILGKQSERACTELISFEIVLRDRFLWTL